MPWYRTRLNRGGGTRAGENLVWRGVATAALQKDPNKGEKQLRKATNKMFKEFPPGAK